MPGDRRVDLGEVDEGVKAAVGPRHEGIARDELADPDEAISDDLGIATLRIDRSDVRLDHLAGDVGERHVAVMGAAPRNTAGGGPGKA
jgi:hypothetical protein